MLATLSSSVLSNLASILATVALVRLMGADGFGRVALLSVGATALAGVSTAGASLYVVRLLSVGHTRADTPDLGSKLTAASVAAQALALLLNSIGLLVALTGAVQLNGFELALAGTAVHMLAADAQAKARLMGRQQALRLAFATLVGSLGSVSLQLLGAHAAGSLGYLAGFALGSSLQWACSALCSRPAHPRPRVWRESVSMLRDRQFLTFVMPATISASIAPAAQWCASAIAASKTGRFGEVAVLTVAMQLFNVVVFVPAVLNKLLLPHTLRADSLAQDTDHSRRNALRQATWLLCVMAVLPLALMPCQDLIAKLYRFDDAAAGLTLIAFAGAAVFACAGIPISNYFVSQQRMMFSLATNLFWAGLYLGLSWLLPGGASAAGKALLIAYIATLALGMMPLILRA